VLSARRRSRGSGVDPLGERQQIGSDGHVTRVAAAIEPSSFAAPRSFAW
jgi:hypothetical protein